jgi:RNA polymerase sigma factor (sigma-70 family)
MANGQLAPVVDYLRRTALALEDGLTDHQLLDRFRRAREEGAFEAIVRRHGAMVLGVCRRVLRHAHDAEDAFQATFLVLARKAQSVRRPERLASWLYAVAYRTAVEAKMLAARRRAKERHMARPEALEPATACDWRDVLDRELNRLPEKYRVPVVLCDLEGLPRQEVAGQLGWPEGTLSGRLTRARRMLARLLARRGLALPGGLLAAALSEGASAAAVPERLVAPTVRAAVAAAGNAAAIGLGGTQAAVLMERVVRAMFLTKIKIVTAVLLAAATAALGGGLLLRQAAAFPHGREPGRVAGPRLLAKSSPAGREARRRDEEKPRPDQEAGEPVEPPVGRPDKPLAKKKQKEDPKKKAEAETEALVALLLKATKEEDQTIRRMASISLMLLGRDAVPALEALVKGDDRVAREHALAILSSLSPKVQEAKAALARLYKDEKLLVQTLKAVHPLNRQSALLALSRKGVADVPLLVRLGALGEKEPEIARTALTTLLALGRDAVPGLVALLKSKDEATRAYALAVLCVQARSVAEAREALERLFKDEKMLANALKSPNEAVRQAAVQAMSQRGRAAVPALVRLVEGKDPSLRCKAIESLGQLGEQGRDALPALVKAYKAEGSVTERRVIMTAITQILATNPSAREAIKRIQQRGLYDKP